MSTIPPPWRPNGKRMDPNEQAIIIAEPGGFAFLVPVKRLLTSMGTCRLPGACG